MPSLATYSWDPKTLICLNGRSPVSWHHPQSFGTEHWTVIVSHTYFPTANIPHLLLCTLLCCSVLCHEFWPGPGPWSHPSKPTNCSPISIIRHLTKMKEQRQLSNDPPWQQIPRIKTKKQVSPFEAGPKILMTRSWTQDGLFYTQDHHRWHGTTISAHQCPGEFP